VIINVDGGLLTLLTVTCDQQRAHRRTYMTHTVLRPSNRRPY